MSNFTVRLSGKVSGFFIAAPGTSIDSASTLNGWVDAGTTYGGSGTPGADTGNGGNGSNNRKRKGPPKPPPKYKVIYHNDEHTPVEFITWSLMSFFNKNFNNLR